ncbi:MAG: trypsin-like peptidase domain-containing protein [Planctomycetes bacterium]|nr:trypsin-like peptidase domain-containing protein [Planctomycetota bacterium]
MNDKRSIVIASAARQPRRPAGVSQFPAWLVLGTLALVLVIVLTGAQRGPVQGYSQGAQPRPIAARGQLMVDEEVAIKAFHLVSASVVFVTNKQVNRDLFHLHTADVEEDAGSGFVWDPNGYIVTNYHVVQNSDVVQVTLGDQSIWKAKRVGTDPEKDVAVLKIEAPAKLLPAIPIGTSSDLQVGQRVFAIGNPFGYDQTLTSGVISGLGREITGAGNRPIRGVIQTDAPMNPGNSGGPLLDSAGRVIGMNTAILSPTGAYAGIGFAIPIDCINWIVPEIISGRAVARPNLGITTAPDHLVHRLGLDGALILTISPNTSAEKAGLRGTRRDDSGKIVLGDLIVAVDGEPVRTTDDLFRAVDKHKVGEVVPLTIVREGKKMDVPVHLDPLP